MESRVETALRMLHDFISDKKFAEELGRAKKQFFDTVGAPLPGEPIEELRLASFVEWFIFDRTLDRTGRTPVEEFLRLNSNDEDVDLSLFDGFTGAVRGVFMVTRRKNGDVVLKDLSTGIKYKSVRRVPQSFGKGDIAELRLVLNREGTFATDALCYHPYWAKKNIRKMMKKAKKEGRPVDEVLDTLMAMNTRFEHYPKTAKKRAYES